MRQLLRALLPALLLIASLPAGAQYPAKPVRLLVGFAPGGGVDILARQLAQKLTERWGKPVVVENRSGAAGNIATGIVAKSAPDGYTLLLAFSSHASNPALYPDLPFDIRKDFTAITLVATAPVTVAVHPSVPAANLAELIAHARSHPGAVRFASSGIGTPVHLAGELMMQLTGIRMTHVPYKGIAPAMAAMLGAETEGFEIDYWYALLGPAGLPAPIVEQLQREISQIVTTQEMKESLLDQGSIAIGSPPEELNALIRSEYALWSRVVKAGNVRVE